MSTNQQRLRLNVYVHGQHALSMEANPDRPARLDRGEAMPWLSSTWSGDEERVAAQLWLLCCLPENGVLEQWVGEALSALRRLGGFGQVRLPETVLWAHPDSEYPGAMSLTVGDAASPPSHQVPLQDYERLDAADLESLLQDAMAASGGASGRARPSRRWPAASLSGMRPKAAATLDNGVWRLAPKGHLNTAIVKVEDSRRNPGEAGIESLCQQALLQLGLRAAPTQSQVIAGLQCVISERSDRAIANGRVVPIHQEDFRQAGDFGPEKYPEAFDSREMKGWAKAYHVLRQGAEDPDAECDALTRFLAATWMLGHGDLHRGNLGFRVSAPGEGPKRVSVAPAYDVSSAVGSPYSNELVLGIGGQRHPAKVKPGSWREHARTCGLDAARTRDAVADVAARLPDAFADAKRICAAQDENREKDSVAARTEKTARHVRARAREFRSAKERAG